MPDPVRNLSIISSVPTRGSLFSTAAHSLDVRCLSSYFAQIVLVNLPSGAISTFLRSFHSEMAPYVYKALDLSKQAIRLIRLRRNFSLHGQVHIELIQTTAGEVPFEALSYTWGSLDKPFNVIVDGICELAVTHNAHVALQHLRLPFEDRLLWIDAICINQENLQERGHQVGQMKLIYECAERVLIWLGNGHPMIDDFFTTLNSIRHRLLSNDSRSQGDPVTGTVLRACLKPHHIAVFQALMRSHWFKRIWILQEVASARAAMVLCGRNAISARLFTMIPSAFDIKISQRCQAVLDIMPGPSRKHSWWAERRDLRTLLSRFSTSEATDERDKVYALMGICSDYVIASAYITLDYSRSLTSVSHDVLKYTIRQVLDISLEEIPPDILSEMYKFSGPDFDVKERIVARHIDQFESMVFDWILQQAVKPQNESPQLSFAEALALESFFTIRLARSRCNIQAQKLLFRLFHPRNRFTFDIVAHICFLAESGIDAFTDLFQQLLENDEVDFGVANKTGDTVLHRAAAGWPPALFGRLLLRQDVDPNGQNIYGVTPLLVAFLNGQLPLMEMLVERREIDMGLKAQMMYGSYVLGDFRSIFHVATLHTVTGVSLQNPSFWTPPESHREYVDRFADRDQVGVRRELVNLFCDRAIRSEDWSGASPLVIDCNCQKERNPMPEDVRPKARLEWSDKEGEDILDVAVARGDLGGVEAILAIARRCGHIFDIRQSLQRAVTGRRVEIVRLLLSYSRQRDYGISERSSQDVVSEICTEVSAHADTRLMLQHMCMQDGIERRDLSVEHDEGCAFEHIADWVAVSELFAGSKRWHLRHVAASVDLKGFDSRQHYRQIWRNLRSRKSDGNGRVQE